MMDREKRRNIIRKLVRFWFRHNLAIAVTLCTLVIVTLLGIIYACIFYKPNNDGDKGTYAYEELFEKDSEGNVVNNTRKNKNKTIVTAEGTEEIVEYSTILKYNADTKPGYMNNCIFLGDSRTVAMVSYGFVSDENVLAKVGISHTSVMKSTFTQNSGKEYTVKKYLESHKAPVIYLAFGVNGMNGISEEKYEKSFKEMVEEIMNLAPDSDIVIMAIGPVYDNGTYKKSVQNSWINKYNEFLISLAEYEGIYYLDIDTVLKGEDGQVKPEYDAGDGLHYKACAYTVMLEYIIHHPVVGVSDEGEFVVKYVKPTGQFRRMITEETDLPANVVVEDSSNPTTVAEPEVMEGLITPTPTPTPTVISKDENVAKPMPTLSPSPTVTPKITITPTPVITQAEEAGPTPVASVTEGPTPPEENSNPEVAEPTKEPEGGDNGGDNTDNPGEPSPEPVPPAEDTQDNGAENGE